MSLFDSIQQGASRVTGEVQTSVIRARLEAERRLLGRQHRAALETLGQRAYELVRTGALPAEPLAAEISVVDERLDEIEAKLAEIDTLGNDGPGGNGSTPSAGPGWDAADAYFSS
jgi:hypothetical protein